MSSKQRPTHIPLTTEQISFITGKFKDFNLVSVPILPSDFSNCSFDGHFHVSRANGPYEDTLSLWDGERSFVREGLLKAREVFIFPCPGKNPLILYVDIGHLQIKTPIEKKIVFVQPACVQKQQQFTLELPAPDHHFAWMTTESYQVFSQSGIPFSLVRHCGPIVQIIVDSSIIESSKDLFLDSIPIQAHVIHNASYNPVTLKTEAKMSDSDIGNLIFKLITSGYKHVSLHLYKLRIWLPAAKATHEELNKIRQVDPPNILNVIPRTRLPQLPKATTGASLMTYAKDTVVTLCSVNPAVIVTKAIVDVFLTKFAALKLKMCKKIADDLRSCAFFIKPTDITPELQSFTIGCGGQLGLIVTIGGGSNDPPNV